MPISEWIERFGRAVFESPFAAMDVARNTPELAEIRLALLDAVKARSHRVAGRDVFPHNVVKIRLLGVPLEQAAAFNSRFFAEFCQTELRAGLTKSECRFPSDLRVEIETTPSLPGPKEHWLTVEAETQEVPAAPVAGKKSGKLIVVKGAANVRELPITKARTNIGRTVDIFRADGPSRRNDLAFEENNGISRTVSREHAHITYSKKTGEYRLFNDRSYQPGPGPSGACGLWIIRDGLSYEVHRGVRGVRLEPGDEISLGRALVKFACK